MCVRVYLQGEGACGGHRHHISWSCLKWGLRTNAGPSIWSVSTSLTHWAFSPVPQIHPDVTSFPSFLEGFNLPYHRWAASSRLKSNLQTKSASSWELRILLWRHDTGVFRKGQKQATPRSLATQAFPGKQPPKFSGTLASESIKMNGLD